MYKDNNISGVSQESKTTTILLINIVILLISCIRVQCIRQNKATIHPLKYAII